MADDAYSSQLHSDDELLQKFNNWMKSYTHNVQSKLQTIITLQRKLNIENETETILRLSTSHPDALQCYISELEEKCLPYSEYQDEFNQVMNEIKKACIMKQFDWKQFHPFYNKIYSSKPLNTIDWNQALLTAKQTLNTLQSQD